LYADRAGQLQKRGISRRNALMLVANKAAVPLEGEWVECFWCEQCQQTQWYHIHKIDNRAYQVSAVSPALWEYVAGVIHPEGNPSVGEFTRRQARQSNHKGIKDFLFLR
jgi:hypothetical protein